MRRATAHTTTFSVTPTPHLASSEADTGCGASVSMKPRRRRCSRCAWATRGTAEAGTRDSPRSSTPRPKAWCAVTYADTLRVNHAHAWSAKRNRSRHVATHTYPNLCLPRDTHGNRRVTAPLSPANASDTGTAGFDRRSGPDRIASHSSDTPHGTISANDACSCSHSAVRGCSQRGHSGKPTHVNKLGVQRQRHGLIQDLQRRLRSGCCTDVIRPDSLDFHAHAIRLLRTTVVITRLSAAGLVTALVSMQGQWWWHPTACMARLPIRSAPTAVAAARLLKQRRPAIGVSHPCAARAIDGLVASVGTVHGRCRDALGGIALR